MILTPSNTILKAGKIKYSQVVKTFSLLMDVMHLKGVSFKSVEILTLLLTVTTIYLKEHHFVT